MYTITMRHPTALQWTTFMANLNGEDAIYWSNRVAELFPGHMIEIVRVEK